MAIKNENGESLLELFYKDKRRWSYVFQNAALLTRLRAINAAIASTKHSVIITERSVSGREREGQSTSCQLQEERGRAFAAMQLFSRSLTPSLSLTPSHSLTPSASPSPASRCSLTAMSLQRC
jgi:hypothetical protein